MVIRIVSLLILSGFFTQCHMDELPVVVPPPSAISMQQVETGENYGSQIFYNLRDQFIAGTLEKTSWDIALMRQNNRWSIRLNTALGGGAARVQDAFSLVSQAQGLPYSIDASSGNADSTAIQADGAVYVIDRGFDPEGNARGFHKLQVLDTNGQQVTLRLAALDGTQDTTLTLPVDTTRHMVALSFTSYKLPELPHMSDWDVMFTQYMFQFQNPPIAYLVTGVLLHPENTRAAVDTQNTFASIRLQEVSNYTFSSDWDAIGYDWKSYNYDEGRFEVDPEVIYIVETQDGRYVKVQFVDFYTPTGEKGAPLFRIQTL